MLDDYCSSLVGQTSNDLPSTRWDEFRANMKRLIVNFKLGLEVDR